MSCDIVNKTGKDMAQMTQIASDFFPYAQKRLGFDQPVTILLISDEENSLNPFGKTAHYDPNNMQIALYVDGRHPKDILRSLSHELVHHAQNCRGEFDGGMSTEQGYAQKDPHLRKMEAEAYLLGNGFLFRDYEDSLKENKKVSLKEKLRRSINKVLAERKNISEMDLPGLEDDPQPVNVGDKIRGWDADSPGPHHPTAQSRPGKLTFHPSDEGAPRTFATRKPTPLIPPSSEEQLFNVVTTGTPDAQRADQVRASKARPALDGGYLVGGDSVEVLPLADKAGADPRPYGPPVDDSGPAIADPEQAVRTQTGVKEQMNMEDLIREAVKEFIKEQTVEIPDPPEGMDVADVKIPDTGLGAGVDTTVDTDVETDLDTDTPAEMPDLPKPEDLPNVPGGTTMDEGDGHTVDPRGYQSVDPDMGLEEGERPRFGRPGHEDWSPDPSAAAMASQNQVNVAETKETLQEWKNRTLNEMLMSKFIKKESK